MGLQLPELSELSELSVSGYLATWLPGSLIALWLPGSQVAWSQGGQKRSRAALRIPGRGCQVWRQAGRRHSRGRILRIQARVQAREVVFLLILKEMGFSTPLGGTPRSVFLRTLSPLL